MVCKAACTLFLPSPLRIARILWHMIPFVRRGTALPAAPPHQGGAAGCPVYFHFCLQKGLRNRRNGHVSAGGGRAAGGVDKEEICGGSGPVHVAECGPGLAAHSPRRSAGSCVPDPAGDAVVVRAGGIIPVDGLVLEGRSLSTRRPLPENPSRYPSAPAARSMPAPW